MKHSKIISVLLMALVSYGQLAAYVHMVGHFHSVDHFQAVDHIHSDEEDHVHLTLLAAAPHDGEQTESSCALYHAVLGMSGLVCASQQVHVQLLQHSEPPAHSVADLFLSLQDDKRIRAPPVVS